MSTAEYVADLLGGHAVFKRAASPTTTELRARVKQGLPYRSFESLRERLRLSIPESASLLRMPARTLARRRQARRLDPDQSDRLYRVARVAGQAVSVFGNEAKAAEWLRRPNRSLEGEAPIALLDTDVGARQVEDILGRIAYGLVG